MKRNWQVVVLRGKTITHKSSFGSKDAAQKNATHLRRVAKTQGYRTVKVSVRRR